MRLSRGLRGDVDLIDVDGEARMCPSRFCSGVSRERVKESIEKYGLNLPKLVGARKQLVREIRYKYENLMERLVECDTVDQAFIDRHTQELRRTTFPDRAYSKTARAELVGLRVPQLCAQPEDLPPTA